MGIETLAAHIIPVIMNLIKLYSVFIIMQYTSETNI